MKGKKLYRSRENAMLAGVCGGVGIWAYIISAVIIPQRPQYIEGETV